MRDEEEESEAEDSTADHWKTLDDAMLVEDEEGFDTDIELMESLFEPGSHKRYKKMLACLDQHTSPVNCVRWNNVGTLFASAADDGAIILWEYVGETIQSDLQRYIY